MDQKNPIHDEPKKFDRAMTLAIFGWTSVFLLILAFIV